MKTERRHELQTNTLADALGHAVDSVKPYSQIMLGAVLAVLVILGVVKYLSIRSQEDVVDAWNRYLQSSTSSSKESTEDLNRLIEQYPQTTAAQWAHLYLADSLLNEGISQLFQNSAEAKEKLRKAEEHYLAVQQKAKDPLLQERATLGLGRTYESLLSLDKAQEQYKKLVDSWPNGAYAPAAHARLEDLSHKSTKEFYDWFANNEPKGTPDSFGTPGSRPSFNLDDVPADIPLNLNPSVTPPSSVDPDKTSSSDDKPEGVSTASRPAGTPAKSETDQP